MDKMRDFVSFCVENSLVNVADDGIVTWTEAAVKGGEKGKYTDKFDGGRDVRDDLDKGDYENYCRHMGTVWPFKVLAKGGKKQAAPSK